MLASLLSESSLLMSLPPKQFRKFCNKAGGEEEEGTCCTFLSNFDEILSLAACQGREQRVLILHSRKSGVSLFNFLLGVLDDVDDGNEDTRVTSNK